MLTEITKSNRKRKTKEELIFAALLYTRRVDFQKNNNPAYKQAWRRGPAFLDIVCAHMEEPSNLAFTLEELTCIAHKYTKKMDFKKNNEAAYQAAWKREDFEEICSHMDPPLTQAYSFDELYQEAKKYLNRSDFREHSHNHWQIARKRKILDQICSHMKRSSGTSKQELELFGRIKAICPEAKKLRDMQVKIEGKSHIHGFDIDIFIPDLNLGIEFDGKYHHSFEAMRADPKRSKWSDDDIRNYHNLKDTWFWSSKGIKILHIKWDDWIADKQACIQRCFDFLGAKA